MKKTEKLIYTNANGEAIELSHFSPFFPSDFSEELDSDIVTVKSHYQDGETFVSKNLQPREMAISGFFLLSRSNNMLERKLRRVFNPKLSGVLTFHALDFVRQIDAMPLAIPEINKQGRRGIFNIELIAHNPFWREAERMEFLALLKPLFHFPVAIPAGGLMFGMRAPTQQTEIENIGDVETGFRVVFKARGTVINPGITNVMSEETIKILYEMAKDDVIEVISQPGRKQVLINGIKSFQYLDRMNSTFFSLTPGKNIMGYRADENTVNLDVIVYYSPAYL